MTNEELERNGWTPIGSRDNEPATGVEVELRRDDGVIVPGAGPIAVRMARTAGNFTHWRRKQLCSSELHPDVSSMLKASAMATAGMVSFCVGYRYGQQDTAVRSGLPEEPSNEPSPVDVERIKKTLTCSNTKCGHTTTVEVIRVTSPTHLDSYPASDVSLGNVSPLWIIGLDIDHGYECGDETIELGEKHFCSTECLVVHVQEAELAQRRRLYNERMKAYVARILNKNVTEHGRRALVAEFGENLEQAVRDGRLK